MTAESQLSNCPHNAQGNLLEDVSIDLIQQCLMAQLDCALSLKNVDVEYIKTSTNPDDHTKTENETGSLHGLTIPNGLTERTHAR